MKRVAILFGAMALALQLAGCGTVGGWFGGGPQAAKPAELVEFKATAGVTLGWNTPVGAGKPYSFSPDADAQALYVAARAGRIARLDPATGREVWRVESGKPLTSGVGADEGLVLVGTRKGEVLAYRGEDGQPLWTAKLSGEILTAPIAYRGWVAARGNDGRVYLLNAQDGKQRWAFSRALPALVLREPGNLLITDKAVYAGYPGGKLLALSVANGAPLWEANVALPRGANELERIADVTGAIASDGRMVCASAFQGRVACFDLDKGQPVWARDFSGLTGVEVDGRYVYAADEHGTVQAYDKARGGSLWKQDKLRDRKLSTPLALERYLAVGDYQGYVHLLNIEDGSFAARVATDGSPITGRMLRLAQGLVVQTANGGVYAFKIQ